MKIGISIINYNGLDNTIECLKSLDSIEILKNYVIKIIVLDNASKIPFTLPNNVIQNIAVEVIHEKENKGFSGGHNVVIRRFLEEEFDYVLILNNDTTVDKKFLFFLVEAIQTSKNIGVVGPKIYFSKGSEFHKDRYKKEDSGKIIWYAGGKMDWENVLGFHRGVDEIDAGQYNVLEQTDFASGCCMLLNIDVLKKVGMFDERYFLYYEDSDLQMRIINTGYKIMYQPKAFLWHKNAGSAGGSGSPLQDYFITRNRLLFGLSYAAWRARFALIRESLKLLIYGRKEQKQGVMDFYLMHFGKGSFIHD